MPPDEAGGLDEPPPLLGVSPERMAALRRQLQAQQAAIDANAFSGDGRTFQFEAPLAAGFAPGTFVSIALRGQGRLLGQIISQSLAEREGADLTFDIGVDMSRFLEGARISRAGVRMRIRQVIGEGVLLGRETRGGIAPTTHKEVFDNCEIIPADGEFVSRYLSAMGGRRVRFDVGQLERCEDEPRAIIRSDGLNRHTFLCGQSGSGKTYSLGLFIERILLHTSLRVVIIDPNSDFVRISEMRPAREVSGGVEGDYRDLSKRYAAAVKNLRLLRPDGAATRRSDARLRVAFSDLTREEQAAVLRLDPLDSRDEYSEFWRIADAVGKARYSLADVHRTAGGFLSEEARHVRLRIENLGIGNWRTWAGEDEPSIGDHIKSDWRALVLDTGRIANASEKSVVALAALEHLWRLRERREPVLVVIDEAHNVCPAEPANAVQEQAMEHCIRIAGEGRKYGLYLFLASQRPQKVHPNVLSQCDNLVLMRMNSRSDLQTLSEVFSFVPDGLMQEATQFKLGEALLAGKIAPTPLFAALQGRFTREGGADVPATWADRRD
jgi:DNA helicase HerA-like ATPase